MVDGAGLPERRAAETTIGIDMGGTFVDCVVHRSDGSTVESKVATTPDDPVSGIVAALHAASGRAGVPLETLLGEATALVHGTTLGLNAVLARTGGRVGLLATRGHEDALAIGRVHQKVAGLRPDELTRASELRKPTPLVPRWDIAGIHERVDATGSVVVALDEIGVVEAARRLVGGGCQVLAVAFLWSHVRPDHERRAAELIQAALPGVPVVISSDVAPVLGEYERTAATIVDAALLAPFRGYLDRVGQAVRSAGFGGRLWVMGMIGGVVAWDSAAARPVDTLRSGPVGGIIASGRIGARVGRRSIITTDMGGTSFDVGLLVDGTPLQADTTVVGQFHLAIPSIDVRSIGAGGGSIAWLDGSGVHVGPRSAGADPGPACYGRGGTEPTVTDADLVLGRLEPGAVLGGAISLDLGAAEGALRPLADGLGLDIVATAAGIIRVADAQMANLIRTSSLERGHDPRRFTLVAYGGAGPLHVGRFGADLGFEEALIPPSASVLSALGLATADHRRTYRRSRRLRLPVDSEELGSIVAELRHEAIGDLGASGRRRPPDPVAMGRDALPAADAPPADTDRRGRDREGRRRRARRHVRDPVRPDVRARDRLCGGRHRDHCSRPRCHRGARTVGSGGGGARARGTVSGAAGRTADGAARCQVETGLVRRLAGHTDPGPDRPDPGPTRRRPSHHRLGFDLGGRPSRTGGLDR